VHTGVCTYEYRGKRVDRSPDVSPSGDIALWLVVMR
jgi:hypothetical protein